ncbi:MAG TPA: carboxymuconolactone decarboxylase family protein [Acidobacteriota bacterium]|nr:carboxymuconolactone decarboxylase family protein [Acidobacteriota bacterium]
MANEYTIYNEENAPEEARETLKQVKKAYGFLPNLIGLMAESPALAKSYTALSAAFDETSFSAAEKQTVLLAASYVNECGYCMAAHSTVAQMTKVPEDVVEALRTGQPIQDTKLEALRRLTEEIVVERGWPSELAVENFLDAGYERKHILEVLVGVAMKTVSNYTNHVADTPLDAAFAANRWDKTAAVVG